MYMYFLAWCSVSMPCATLAGCDMFATHLGAFVNCVPVEYSIDWRYVLPRGCASIVGLDTLVAYGLYDLGIYVGHMLYVLSAVLHTLCVMLLHSVLIGDHYILRLQPKCTFGYRPHFADVFMANMLYIYAPSTQLSAIGSVCLYTLPGCVFE